MASRTNKEFRFVFKKSIQKSPIENVHDKLCEHISSNTEAGSKHRCSGKVGQIPYNIQCHITDHTFWCHILHSDNIRLKAA